MSWAAASMGFQFLGAFGQYRRDKYAHKYRLQVARARAKYTKDVAYNHAILAEQEAADVLRSGRKAQELLGRKAAQAVSGIRAGMASSGFTVDGGDVYKLGEDVRMLHREDANELRRRTHRRADLLKYKAKMLRHGADYNQQLAGHDPGGPSWGGYFLGALAGSINIAHRSGMKFPSFGGSGGTYASGAPLTGPHG